MFHLKCNWFHQYVILSNCSFIEIIWQLSKWLRFLMQLPNLKLQYISIWGDSCSCSSWGQLVQLTDLHTFLLYN